MPWRQLLRAAMRHTLICALPLPPRFHIQPLSLSSPCFRAADAAIHERQRHYASAATLKHADMLLRCRRQDAAATRQRDAAAATLMIFVDAAAAYVS